MINIFPSEFWVIINCRCPYINRLIEHHLRIYLYQIVKGNSYRLGEYVPANKYLLSFKYMSPDKSKVVQNKNKRRYIGEGECVKYNLYIRNLVMYLDIYNMIFRRFDVEKIDS